MGGNNFMMKLPELTDEKKSRLDDILKYLEEKRMGYINVPTGWGKNFLSKHLIQQI